MPVPPRSTPVSWTLALAVGMAVLAGAASGCQPASGGGDPPVVSSRHTLSIPNGLTLNGVAGNGITLNGITLNGITLNGVTLNGITLNGITLNGITLNGITLNGITLNGITLNGVTLNGITLNGVTLNGITLNGITLNGITLNGVALAEPEVDAVKVALELLAACALAPGDSITVQDVDGSPLVYDGAFGLDPRWASDVPDLTRSDEVGMCVLDLATAAGHAVSHTPVQLDAFKTVLHYMIQCALPEGRSVIVYNENGAPTAYDGSLGLAPEWETTPLDPTGQRRVSACLAARTNASGKTVQISMRGLGMEITPLERARFGQHEGAFAANLFADSPYVKSCDVSGGIAGRTCASDPATCGFTTMGDCAAACTPDPDGGPGAYANCDGGAETEVISTFLALDHSVALGKRHTCIRQLDGYIQCWGNNQHGQLGIATAGDITYTTPQTVTPPGAIDALASSYQHTCSRGANGALTCWGRNSYGQLGDGTTVSQPAPTPVQALGLDVIQVSADNHNTCAVTATGQLWCWGGNSYGQLGDGTTVDQVLPQQVPGLSGTLESAAGRHTCALDGAGTIRCWGYNSNGQVGDGTTANRTSPVEIVSGAAVDVCIGFRHTCAALDDGSVQCWGYNGDGALGDGTTADRPAPGPVLGLPAAATGVYCGHEHSCALLDDGAMRCWWNGEDAQLGNCATADSAAPVAMTFYRCGDGVCEPGRGETHLTCSADCAGCGDGTCDPGEDCHSCSLDCGACGADGPSCGDGACDPGEHCGSCPADCASGPTCGDGTCEAGEDCTACPADCGSCGPVCGDGTCEAGEDCTACPADCGPCQICNLPGDYCAADADCCSGSCRIKKKQCR